MLWPEYSISAAVSAAIWRGVMITSEYAVLLRTCLRTADLRQYFSAFSVDTKVDT